jgi:hypothetical protein
VVVERLAVEYLQVLLPAPLPEYRGILPDLLLEIPLETPAR